MKQLDISEIKFLNSIILDRDISETKARSIATRINKSSMTPRQYLLELFFSAHFNQHAAELATELHLYYIHHARIQMVSTLLPQADVILDLGGANGSIVDMGYPHKFKKITVVDLPPKDRDAMYKNLKVKETKTANGIINVHFGDMSNLKFAKDNSVDLVWSGESIEHIPETAADKMIKEAFRVLRPGGYFCLDTPNRFLTEIHTNGLDFPFIHPEHKIEYYPEQLQKKLKQAGFNITERKGVREMPSTYSSGVIDYTDFISGKPLSDNIDMSYMQYYSCQKPVPISVKKELRGLARKAKGRASLLKKKIAN